MCLFLSLKMEGEEYEMGMVWKNGRMWCGNWRYIRGVVGWMVVFIGIVMGKWGVVERIGFDEERVRRLGI